MINSTFHRNEEVIEFSACSAPSIEESGNTNCVANLFVSINVILSITALLGNILILVALQKESSLHPPSKLLLRSLSFTDLLVGLISQPIFVIYLTAMAKKNQNVCGITERLANISSALLCGESITILTAISVDRLLALLLRLRYRQIVNLTRARFLVIFSWTMNTVFAMTYLWQKRFFFIGSCVWIGICLTVSSFCFLKIYVVLRRQQTQVQSCQAHPGASLNMAWYKKTVSSALWIHFTLVVCYLPYTIATAVSTFGGVSPQCNAWSIPGVLVFLNSTLNPLLYCWKIREVRQAVKHTLRQWFCLS